MNTIEVTGTIKSVKIEGGKSYIDVATKRRSGLSDILPVLVPTNTIYKKGDEVLVKGAVSGKHIEGHLSFTIIASTIELISLQDTEPINTVTVHARIGKLNPQKVAMMTGSPLIDGLLALPETEDYISFVAWGSQVPTVLAYAESRRMFSITGRMQSRQYTKNGKLRTICELSVFSIGEIKMTDTAHKKELNHRQL